MNTKGLSGIWCFGIGKCNTIYPLYKSLFFIAIYGFFSAELNAQSTAVEILPNQEQALRIPKKETSFLSSQTYRIRLKNQSKKEVSIRIVNRLSGVISGGFGLSPKGKTKLSINSNQQVLVSNPHLEKVKIRLRTLPKTQRLEPVVKTQLRNFILVNSSAEPLPLIIPGVMNPSLSPYSESRVLLANGQGIYYRKGVKKQLLLVIGEHLKENTKIDMAILFSQY